MSFEHELREFDGVSRLFPLGGVILFPHAVLALHTFEPRYRQMTQDALNSNGLITIVQPRLTPSAGDEDEPLLEEVGCLGKILRFEKLADGRFNYLLLGLSRLRLVRELEVSTLYRQAETALLRDIEEPSPVEESDELVRLFRAVALREQTVDPDLGKLLDSEVPLGVLTDILAHTLQLPPQVKQTLLEDRHVGNRLRVLLEILRRRLRLGQATSSSTRPFPPPFSTN